MLIDSSQPRGLCFLAQKHDLKSKIKKQRSKEKKYLNLAEEHQEEILKLKCNYNLKLHQTKGTERSDVRN
jgi:hypothetical protein